MDKFYQFFFCKWDILFCFSACLINFFVETWTFWILQYDNWKSCFPFSLEINCCLLWATDIYLLNDFTNDFLQILCCCVWSLKYPFHCLSSQLRFPESFYKCLNLAGVFFVKHSFCCCKFLTRLQNPPKVYYISFWHPNGCFTGGTTDPWSS